MRGQLHDLDNTYNSKLNKERESTSSAIQKYIDGGPVLYTWSRFTKDTLSKIRIKFTMTL